MEEVDYGIKELFDNKGLTLSVSESLTGGMIQSSLVSVSGASSYFQGGVTVYNIGQKVNILGVDREIAEPVDCVSEEVAIQMAKGCRELFKSDVSTGITGYAGGELEDKSYCYYAIDYKGSLISGKFEAPENMGRNQNREYFTDMLCSLLYDFIRKY